MKKLISIILLFSVCILLTGCPPSNKFPWHYKYGEIKELYIEDLTYSSFEEAEKLDNNSICINNVDELILIHKNDEQYIEYFEKYDEAFFKDMTLVIAPFTTTDNYHCKIENERIIRYAVEIAEHQVTKDKYYIAFIEIHNTNKSEEVLTDYKCYFDSYIYETKIFGEVSEFNDELTNKLLNNNYESFGSDELEEISLSLIENMSMDDRIWNLRKIYINQKRQLTENKYNLCAYINKDILDELDTIDKINGEDFNIYFNTNYGKNTTLLGKNYYLAKFNMYYNSQNSDSFEGNKISKNDIIWFNMNEPFEILEEVCGYVLVSILEEDVVTVKNINDFVLRKFSVFREINQDQEIEDAYYNSLLKIGFDPHAAYITFAGDDYLFNDKIYFYTELYEVFEKRSFASYHNAIRYIRVQDELTWNGVLIDEYIEPVLSSITYKGSNNEVVPVKYYEYDKIIALIKDEIM